MRSAIEKVKGAVSKKDFIPILTHLHFYDGRVQASNGKLTIDTPCPEVKVNVTVPMLSFIKALEACDKEPVLTLIGVKLRVSSGKFKADIALHSDVYPISTPDKNSIECESLIQALKLLQDFIGTDATRAWACGVYFNKGIALATNNVVLASVNTEFNEHLNIPTIAIEELLRINVAPEKVAMGDNTATFYWQDGTWMKTSLLATEWPNVAGMLTDTKLPVIPVGFKEDVTKIAPFVDPKKPTIHLHASGIEAVEETKSAEVLGYEFTDSYFRLEPLVSVLKVATEIDFSKYPKPCPFSGNGIRGVLIGCLS